MKFLGNRTQRTILAATCFAITAIVVTSITLVIGSAANSANPAAHAISAFSYTALAREGRRVLTLRLNSDLLVLSDEHNDMLTSQPLAQTSEVILNGSAGDDTLIVDFTCGNPIPAGGLRFEGGAELTREGDGLVIEGGNFQQAIYDYYNTKDGRIVLDGSVINYVGLEPLTNSGTAAAIIFNLPDDGLDNQAILEDDAVAANGMSRLRSGNGSFETTVFSNPATSLTINASDDGEKITVNNVDSGFTAPKNLNGNTGTDGFILGNGASLNGGTINGGAGNDVVDYRAFSTPISVNLGSTAPSLVASLDGGQETPPNGSPATATGTITYNNVTRTFDISMTATGIALADVTGFHIHRAQMGVAGPIIVFLDAPGVGTFTPISGGFTYSATNVALPAIHEGALLGGLTYLNIHTTSFPGGEIRGQIFSSGPFAAAPGTATNTGGLSGIENVFGANSLGQFGDSLVGDLNANIMGGFQGNDVVVGSRGNDLMEGGIAAEHMLGLTTSNALVRFASNTPGVIISTVAITGLVGGESVVGIDLRPANGQVYGLTDQGRFYIINPFTGAATLASTLSGAILSGTAFGVDFNPVPDRLRIVSDTDQDLRVNVDNGVANVDGTLAYAGGDPNSGANPNVVGAAYLNNIVGTPGTTLFVIDSNLDSLAIQNPPNNGVLNTVGGLGFNTSDLVGFDIAGGNRAFASLTAPAAASSGLFTINLDTGAVTLVGTIGGGVPLRGLTTLPDNDFLVWSNGDGSDIMDGGAGDDVVNVNGAPAADDVFAVNPGLGGRLDFARISPAPFSLDIGTTEVLIANGLTGNDTFTLGSLSSVTDLFSVNLNGLSGNDTFNTKAAAGATINVNGGLPTTMPGDALNHDAEGRPVTGDLGPPDGFITSPGVQNVNFLQVEVVNVTNTGDADLSVTKTDTPDPVAAGSNVTYTITVSNAGPGDAFAVQLTDAVPANTTFVSAMQTGGPLFSLTTPPVGGTGNVTATIPQMAAGAFATFSLVVNVVTSPGSSTITNTAMVTSASTDPNPANNSDTETTTLDIPFASINDVTVTEGDVGSVNAVFTVSLSQASGQTVMVDYLTSNGTAVEPADYASAHGTLIFPPGQITRTITVPVNGDTAPEGDETFFVNLMNPVGTILTDTQGLGTIIDDDPGGILQFSESTYSVNENLGLATITVTRTGSLIGTVTVNFATSNGTATGGSDYGNTSGTLTFGPGVVSQTFDIPIVDDLISEGTETVNLALSGPTGGAVLGSPAASLLLILDNEPPPPGSVDIFAVTVANHLLRFNSSQPTVIASNIPITGLQSGEFVLVLDVRPPTAQLYALGSTSRLYVIDTTTGAATQVGSPGSFTLSGTDFGADFNPVPDRLRVVSDSEQNLRLNPDNGTISGTDTPLAYAAGDVNAASNPNVTGAAYTNSFAGATVTTLYGIDSNLDLLVRQGGVNGSPSPNTGQLSTIGSLGVNTTGLTGFDIQASNNRAFASLTAPGATTSQLFTLNLSNGAAALVGTIGGGDLIRDIALAPAATTVAENGDKVTLTVTRAGDTSVPATVDFATLDGTASQKGDYTIALGTLSFAAGETSKTIDVFIIDDNLVEGSESFTVVLSSLTGDFSFNGSNAIIVTITDNDSVPPTTNPIDDSAFFVRQQYLDFLNRGPDPTGLAFWINNIESCGADAACREVRRIHTSAAFVLSIEFQETGGFVIRTQRVAFGKKSNDAALRTSYLQFMRDSRQVGLGVIVGQAGWPTVLENNKQAYISQVVNSAAFIARFPTSLNAADFVDALFASAMVTPSAADRTAAIAAFGGGGTSGRAAALRSAADSNSIRQAEASPMFVLLEYYGYLRRNPTDPPDGNDNGYQFWLTKLNAFGGDFVAAEMVKAFITSFEYRRRFSLN